MKGLTKAWILTAHRCGCCISLSYLWIHVNQHVLVHCYFTITFLDLLLDPDSERIFDHRVHHINQPLLGNLLDLLSFWKIFKDILMLLDDLDHVVHLETIILWHSEMLNRIRFNDYKKNSYFKIMSCLLTLFCSTDQIFKKIDGESIIGWQICLDFNGKKVIHFPLAFIFTGKG